ncbi:MAG: twin-arginine translocase TatA/TatE family subunit [Dehalococcoidia bacterium]|nr:twin-arginine translocase TatA/TatE family subunit [Dehalococcoidia bacterium]
MGFLPSGPEGWVILVIVLIVFGAGRLPQVGGALGRGIREFRVSQKEALEDEDGESEAEAAPDAGDEKKPVETGDAKTPASEAKSAEKEAA